VEYLEVAERVPAPVTESEAVDAEHLSTTQEASVAERPRINALGWTGIGMGAAAVLLWWWRR